MDEIEQLEEVEDSTDEEELQNEEGTGYERFPLAEASEDIRRCARGLQVEQRGGRKDKRKGGNAGAS